MKAYPRRFYHPRFWPVWLGVGLLRLAVLLPLSWQIRLGHWLGTCLYQLMKKRRHVTAVNIRLCFPEKPAQEQARMVREVFQHNAIGLLESASGWWMSDQRLQVPVSMRGLEHLHQALSLGRGVILLGGHFSTLDMGGRLTSRYFAADIMYRRHNNPLMEVIIRRARERHLVQAIERENLRQVLRALRDNHVVWYAPDQDFGPRYSVYAPFFGVPAATITATSRLARLNHSPVLMLAQRRSADNRSYVLEISPPLADFPSADEVADATQINQVLEQAIRQAPTQYMWVHRRFKTHPKGKNYLYR